MEKTKGKPVTAVDVARLAGVSPATVTRIFNPEWEHRVTNRLKDKVLRAAKELNYTPNAYARMLASNKTNIIAIVLGPVTGYYYSQVLLHFIYRLQACGKQVLPFTTDPKTTYDSLMQKIAEYRVDAVIMTSASYTMIFESVESNIPIILFDRVINGAKVKSVCSDSFNGGQKAAEMLLDNGHKKIAFISGNGLASKDYNREYGFISRMHELGATIWATEEGRYAHYSSGYNAARRIMQSGAYPDAIFCADDVMAMGTIDVLRDEFNVNVPDDISVVGFHDIPEASLPAYSLTTIHTPIRDMVKATLEYIDSFSAKPDDSMKDNTEEKTLFPMKPVIRNSMRVTNKDYEHYRKASANDILDRRIFDTSE